jgi:hypothetical protein
MCVGLWLEKQQWSVAYLLRDPFDYVNSKRKFGLIPNAYGTFFYFFIIFLFFFLFIYYYYFFFSESDRALDERRAQKITRRNIYDLFNLFNWGEEAGRHLPYTLTEKSKKKKKEKKKKKKKTKTKNKKIII